MEERNAKLEALLADDEKAEAVFVEDVQQTLKNLADQGIFMTESELAQLARGIMSGMAETDANDELSEDALDDVAGGLVFFIIGHHHAVGCQKKNKFLSIFPGYNLGYANGQKMTGDYCG